MKKSFVIMLTSVILLTLSCSGEKIGESGLQTDSLPILIMQVQKCSRLYSTEFRVHKIITHDDKLKLEGSIFDKKFSMPLPLGSRKIAIPMDVTLKGYIDFGTFSEKNVHREGNKIEIILPDPKVMLTSSKIDHEAVKQYVALLRSNFSDEELSAYEHQGRTSVIKSIPRLGIIEQARENAAHVLIPLIKNFGYNEQDIVISFRKKFTDKDIPTLMDNSKAGK